MASTFLELANRIALQWQLGGFDLAETALLLLRILEENGALEIIQRTLYQQAQAEEITQAHGLAELMRVIRAILKRDNEKIKNRPGNNDEGMLDKSSN